MPTTCYGDSLEGRREDAWCIASKTEAKECLCASELQIHSEAEATIRSDDNLHSLPKQRW